MTLHARLAVLTALFAGLVGIYVATASGWFHIVDEASRFALTESVAKRGALDTNAIAWTQWVKLPREVQGAFGPEGDVYSKKSPAQSFLAVPFYLVGWLLPGLSMLQTALWLNAVVTALVAVLLACTVLALGYRLRVALLSGALYGLGTIAWPYATHFFGEPLSTLAIIGTFYAILRLRQTGKKRYAAGAGVMAGLMIATSFSHALLLLPLGAYLLYAVGTRWRATGVGTPDGAPAGRRGDLVRSVALFAVPLICALGLLVWYNAIRFGTLFTTGYDFDAGEGFSGNWLQGLWGLLLSPYRGFFWYTPLAFASVVAWRGFTRRHKAEGWTIAILSLLLVGLYAKWWMWWGGFAWGPRFLVPLSPFVVLVLAPCWAAGQRDAWPRIALAMLAALSVAVQILAVTANYVNFETVLRTLYPTDLADPLKYGPPALINPVHSPILGQVRLLLENATAYTDLGWVSPDGIAWHVPLTALGLAALVATTWWFVARRALRLAELGATASVLTCAVVALLAARVYGAQPQYGTVGQGYVGALAELGERAAPTDGLVTIAPYHYQIPMARYRGRLPIYGYALEPTPPHAETEAVLSRAMERHGRLWLITVGVQPADPGNGVEAWLARQGFKAEDRWVDDARLVAFVSAAGLRPLPLDVPPGGWQLGDGVRLSAVRGYQGTSADGTTLAIELTWVPLAPAKPLRGFLQLLAPDGQPVAVQDGVPAGGYAPSPGWSPGTPVTDRRGLLVPPDLSAGEYALIAGVYEADTGQRLPVRGPAGEWLGDAVPLAIVQVE
jgi:hypothetical protein